MNLKLIFGLFCFVFCEASYSKSSLVSTSYLRSSLECSMHIQGGDVFPWSIAKPFPWADIQGVWKLTDVLVPTYLKARVIRTTSARRILSISIVSDGNCTNPVAEGVGYIDLSESNVIRAIINAGSTKYQMKIAYFNMRDLEIDSSGCDDNVIAASIQQIGARDSEKRSTLLGSETHDGPENVTLKKTSNNLTSICKKSNAR